ncbi:MAG: hypothetical protein HZC47_08465 [Methanobacterium sp.]|uniref:hypothetical protein n=1 Tax=Methanobacterium sp. TaxID=2164 RepID=UPI003D65A6E2|nr:hypothetical protein [Methanobacterium sp.]
MDSRGIITSDLIFASILILMVIGSILTIITERLDAVSKTEETGKARMIAENVAEIINNVYSGGNGHSANISLPANITDKNYEIKINSSGVFVLIDGMIGKAYVAPNKFSSSDLFKETSICMHNNRKYLIKNVADEDGNNWIIITET